MGLAEGVSGILFDMDGVLLDTMSAHVRAWVAACGELRLALDEHEVYLREGEKAEVSARDFIKANGMMTTKARVRTLVEAKERLFAQYARQPSVFPGAVDLLSACRERGLRLALVTGTQRVEMQSVLPAELAEFFTASVCGDEVLRGKPNPEPYLTAAMKLGLQPRQCLAVENAPYGIRSAKTAGCRVIAVRSYLGDQDLAEADVLLDDLPALLAQL